MTEAGTSTAPDERLHAILHDVLWEELAELGIRAHEEVCVREVALELPAGSDKSEPEAVEAAARSWAQGIREQLRAGSSADLVHYPDRRAAAVDMARGILHNNWDRSWAWVQLGLWRSDGERSTANAWRKWCRSIAAKPRQMIPILRAAAVEGVLGEAALQWDRPEWNTLVGALVRYHGAMDFAGRMAFGDGPLRGGEDSTLRRHAELLCDSSPLAETFDGLARKVCASPELARFWATLVLFDTEPSLSFAKPEQAARLVQVLALRFVDEEVSLPEETLIIQAPSAEGRLVDRVLDSPPEPPFETDVAPLVATVESILSDANGNATEPRPPVRRGDTGVFPNVRAMGTAGD